MRVTKSGNFGDVKNLTATIDGKNINQFVVHAAIYQDIFTPCWSAVITIQDNANILMNIPIRPGSALSLTVETQTESQLDGDKSYDFIIYKIGDKRLKGQMNQRYDLFCASKGFLTNQTVRIQKTYSNQKPEDAVSNICSEFLGGSLSQSDSSDVNYHVIVPNWTPYIAGWWFAKLALKENRSDYVFFMKDFDQYWFRSLEVLYTNEDTGITFKQRPSHVRDDSGNFKDDYSIMINKFMTFHYDGMGNLGAGYYRTKLLSYDVISKKWENKTFSFGDDLSADKEKKPWDVFDQAENANVSFLPKHPGLHSNPTIDDQVTNWHVSRKSRLMKLEQDKLQIQIPGGAKVWEFLGKKCAVELPSHQDQTDEVYDKYFKGDYLVSHVMHSITQNYYVANMELLKSRLEERMQSSGV
jgi:hypothetical protein